MTVEQKILLIGIGIFLLFISGFLMKKQGKPYKTGIFTMHKLIALGVFVLSILLLLRAYQDQLAIGIDQILFALINILILTAFITGGIISVKQEVKKSLKLLHKASSFLILGAAVVIVALRVMNSA